RETVAFWLQIDGFGAKGPLMSRAGVIFIVTLFTVELAITTHRAFSLTKAPTASHAAPPASAAAGSSPTVAPQTGQRSPASAGEPGESLAPSDLYGNEVDDAVARYSLDPAGGEYEEHSPDTELPRLAAPKT